MTTAVVNFDSQVGRRIGPPPLVSAVTSWNGLTGNVKGTLAEIWSFGQGDAPLTDNLFAWPSGNFRFLGQRAAFGELIPATAFFESATTPGDPRVGSDYFRRYYQTSILVGGFVADQFDGFDPAWNGLFSGLGGFTVESERIGFSHGTGAETAPQEELFIGRQVWQQVGGFFDGPSTFPLPGFNSGQREDVGIDLWNDLDDSVGPPSVRRRHTLNGWGQNIVNTLPKSHGITAAFEADVDWRFLATAAGDGVGLFVRHGTDDPPRALIDAYMVTASPNGAWGWEMWGDDGTGTLGRMFRCDWTNGAVFNVPFKLPASTSFADGAAAAQVYQAVVDGTALGTTQIIPARAGFTFFGIRWALYMLSGAGTATSSLILQVGNNGATFNNQIGPVTTPASALNPSIAIAPVQLTSGATNGQVALADGAAPSMVNVTTKAAGMTSCQVLLILHGIWRPT